MSEPPAPVPSAYERVLGHCDDYVSWYERVKVVSRRFDYGLQFAVIALTAITPLLILTDAVPPVVQALPASLAAIAAGMQGTFKYRERYLGFAMAAELLKAERLRFLLRMAELEPGEPGYAAEVERFASRVNRIVLTETADWRRHLSLQPAPAGTRQAGATEAT